ncbi:MAG: hypothetical protein UV53_C0013G0003 [Candidatus Azambacteria bacterium GW2011_GWE1_42_9]|nr:MAG: hypothetical protein UV53_C0013G0003 [Candidatus Azambacteria bacterium GW2011_GWE1_42_9]KKT03097.1 MAG: hypothetical protein UV81_C0004G0034 [Candidatus Azambacteria bacterium GW2011_GWD1_43_18]KKT17110.1 MAG: hypothetical protein UV99_C0001G0046 [Parcubacteria group bacterium GW2011_GWC1_43_61]OGD40979.1 MAG: hypothetical protein A3K28_00225 [Candidatus Azambacteria bacterium RIFOXYB1_FULL_40_33]OGD42354.1 MAG: hypothetical protein A2193_00235 [Candidatus Azambacteria bacterium RIFOXY
MIFRFLLRVIANALAVLVAARFAPGVTYNFEPFTLAKIALILALANALLKPLLKLIMGPIILMTLGLFTIAINIFLIWLTAYLVPALHINDFSAYFFTMIIVGLFNFAISTIAKKDDD